MSTNIVFSIVGGFLNGIRGFFSSKLRIVFAACVTGIVIGVVAIHLYFGAIVKNGVEFFTAKYLGLQTTIGDVDISFLSGTATIEDLAIKNPQGFSKNNAFYLKEFKIKLDLSTISKNIIRIDHILVRNPVVGFEKSRGISNLAAIHERVERFSGGQKRRTASSSSSSKKKVVIKHFKMWDGEVMANLHGVKLDVPIPNIEMYDIGAENGQNGMDAAKAAKLILSQIMKKVMAINPGKLIEGLGKTLGAAAGEVGKAAGAVGGAAVKGVGKAAEGVGDAVKGVGDVFGL